jgi:hypothetical protein
MEEEEEEGEADQATMLLLRKPAVLGMRARGEEEGKMMA